MFTRLGLVATVFGLFVVLSVSGIIPTDGPVGGLMLTVSFFVTGFLAAFKTEEMISPIFKSSRFGMISLKILGWWFIIVGFMYAAGFVVGMFRLLFD